MRCPVAETGREAFERIAKAKWPTVVLTKDKCGEYIDETLEDIHDGWILCLDAAIAKLRERRNELLGAKNEFEVGCAAQIESDIAALEGMKQ